MRMIVLVCSTLTVLALPLAAQQEMPRPRLPPDLDTNDARDYVSWGNRDDVSWKDAANAYYWARRLEPDNSNWLYAYWRGLWFRQPAGWREQYSEGAKFVLKTKEAREIDSLFGEVLIRNPYPHLRRPCMLVEGLERQRDRAMVGLIHYENGCYPQALEAFGQALQKNPSLLVIHIYRARAEYFRGKYAAAVGELQTLLDSLRARDEKHLAHWYDSKEMFEYMIGMAEWAADHVPQARDAFGRALTEDLSFYMAHARLGAIARDTRDREQAVAEYELAVGLKPDDGALRREFGAALLEAGRLDEAEAQLREAMKIEPYWALPWFDLGVTLAKAQKDEDALAAFETFVKRAPPRWTDDMTRARAYIKTLKQKLGTGG